MFGCKVLCIDFHYGLLVQLASDGTIQSSERLDRLLSLQKEIQVTEQRLSGLTEELQELGMMLSTNRIWCRP